MEVLTEILSLVLLWQIFAFWVQTVTFTLHIPFHDKALLGSVDEGESSNCDYTLILVTQKNNQLLP